MAIVEASSTGTPGPKPEARTMPAGLLDLPGTERLARYVDGQAPPSGIQLLTGIRPVSAHGSNAVFQMPAERTLVDDSYTVPVGVLATLVDGALGWAVVGALPAGATCATVGLNVSVVRRVGAGSLLTAKSHLIVSDDRTALSNAVISDSAGEVARGTARSVVFSQGTVLNSPIVMSDIASLPAQEPASPMGGIASHDCPVHDLFGIRQVEGHDGSATLVMTADNRIEQTMGSAQGGALALLAERAMASAISTTLPARQAAYLIDLDVEFVRPQRADGELLTARGRVHHRGRRLALTSVSLANSHGELVAFGTGAASIVDRMDGSLG